MKIKILNTFLMWIVLLNCVAHPHVWVDNIVKPVLNSEGITGFFVEWSFDETTSAVVIEDFDANKDGKFDQNETQTIYDETFVYLAEDNFYTKIIVDGEEVKIPKPDSLIIETDGWVNTYKFFFPFEIKATRNLRKIIVAQYDETYFIDFALNKKIETVNEPSGFRVYMKIEEDREASYYYDQVTPIVLKIDLEKL